MDNKKGNYTKLDNEIIDFLFSCELSLHELQIFIFIIRQTYGFSRFEAQITNSYIAQGTGIDERQVRRVLKKLEEKEIISRQKISRIKRQIISVKEGIFYPGKTCTFRRVKHARERGYNLPPIRRVKHTPQEIKEEIKDKEIKKEERDFTSFLPENLRDKDTDDMTEEEFEIWYRTREDFENGNL